MRVVDRASMIVQLPPNHCGVVVRTTLVSANHQVRVRRGKTIEDCQEMIPFFALDPVKWMCALLSPMQREIPVSLPHVPEKVTFDSKGLAFLFSVENTVFKVYVVNDKGDVSFFSYANIFDDGHICWGTGAPKMTCLSKAWEYFWTSPFNDHLMPPPLRATAVEGTLPPLVWGSVNEIMEHIFTWMDDMAADDNTNNIRTHPARIMSRLQAQYAELRQKEVDMEYMLDLNFARAMREIQRAHVTHVKRGGRTLRTEEEVYRDAKRHHDYLNAAHSEGYYCDWAFPWAIGGKGPMRKYLPQFFDFAETGHEHEQQIAHDRTLMLIDNMPDKRMNRLRDYGFPKKRKPVFLDYLWLSWSAIRVFYGLRLLTEKASEFYAQSLLAEPGDRIYACTLRECVKLALDNAKIEAKMALENGISCAKNMLEDPARFEQHRINFVRWVQNFVVIPEHIAEIILPLLRISNTNSGLKNNTTSQENVVREVRQWLAAMTVIQSNLEEGNVEVPMGAAVMRYFRADRAECILRVIHLLRDWQPDLHTRIVEAFGGPTSTPKKKAAAQMAYLQSEWSRGLVFNKKLDTLMNPTANSQEQTHIYYPPGVAALMRIPEKLLRLGEPGHPRVADINGKYPVQMRAMRRLVLAPAKKVPNTGFLFAARIGDLTFVSDGKTTRSTARLPKLVRESIEQLTKEEEHAD